LYIQLKKEASGFRALRNSVNLIELNPLKGVPQLGSLCIDFSAKDNFFLRGEMTAVRKINSSGSSMCFFVLVDSGIRQQLKQTQLFQSQMIMRHPQCFATTCLCLTQIMLLNSMVLILWFSSLVDVFKYLQAQVVQREHDFSQIRLLVKANGNSLQNILRYFGTTHLDLG
jgi:hypothetical protein